MRALLLLTVANIKSFMRDRAALFWTLAFPLIFVFLFGSIFTGGDNSRTIGLADLDGSPASAQLKTAFGQVPNLELVEGSENGAGRADARRRPGRRDRRSAGLRAEHRREAGPSDGHRLHRPDAGGGRRRDEAAGRVRRCPR